MRKLIFIFLALVSVNYVNSSNVLFLSAIPSPSHFIYNKVLAYELAAKGHNVTFLSADVEENAPKNVHFIHIENLYIFMNQFMEEFDINEEVNEYLNVMMMYQFMGALCEDALKSKGFEQLMAYPDNFKFDLVIHDYTMSPCMLAVLPKFKYPTQIGITAFSNPPYTADIMGGDRLGLTIKPFYTLNYDKNMNIFQRLNNGFLNFWDALCYKYIVVGQSNKAIETYVGKDIPKMEELIKMTDLALINSNQAIDFAESLPPNVIEVGGLQIKEAQPVDKDIDEFLSKGKKGAILMSLGTNMRSDKLGEENIEKFIKAFAEIPEYNFLWKFETPEHLKDKLPSNVMIKSWVKQNDVLGHANIKAFMTHAGLLSTHEATYHGIPMVGIPFFADQHRNIFRSINAEVAVKIEIRSTTSDQIKAAILEVVNNPKYLENSKIRSKLFRDRPMKPLDLAIWWCEYLLRNPKPSHLKLNNEFKFGLIGSSFWDMQAIILLLLIAIILGIKRLIKKLFSSKNSDKNKKNN